MIRLRGVGKSFPKPGGGRHVALSDVTLDIPEGSLFGLIGPGASGKSLVLKAIAALLKPDHGSVEVLGHSFEQATEAQLEHVRMGIGMLFQNNALFDHMTVFDNVAFPLRRARTCSEAEVRDRVLDRLDRVSLPGFAERMPPSLSGGQKKRVGVARATVTSAKLLVYDEPTAGLDPVTSQKIFDLLRTEQRSTGATSVMVSSDVDRLLTVTDRVGMMLEGRLIFEGTTAELRSSHDSRVRQFVNGLTEGPL